MLNNNGQFIQGDAAPGREFFNQAREASMQAKLGRVGVANSQFDRGARDGDLFDVINTVASALPQFGILAIDAVRIPPTEQAGLNRPVFDGMAPVVDEPFVILQQPAAQNEAAVAAYSGCSWVKVEITDATHDFASCTTSTAQLQSGATGQVRMLYKESGTGVKWAFVRFESAAGGIAWASWDFSDSYAGAGSISNFSTTDSSAFSFSAGTVTISKACTVLLEGRYTYDITSSAWSNPVTGLYWFDNVFTAKIQRTGTATADFVNNWSNPKIQTSGLGTTSNVADISMSGFNESYSYLQAGPHPVIVWRDTGLLGSPVNNESFSGTVTLIQAG